MSATELEIRVTAEMREIRAALARISNATLGFRTNPQGGSLNLAILPTFGTRWLAPRLPQFFSSHPGITINLTTRLSQFDFQLEAVDAAIHFGLPNWPGAELEFLMSETVVPACSPDVAARHGFSRPEDLLRAPLLHLASRPDAWQRWFGSQGCQGGDMQGMLFDQFATAAQAAIADITAPELLAVTSQYPLQRWRQGLRDRIQGEALRLQRWWPGGGAGHAQAALGVVAALAVGDQQAIDRGC